MTSYLDTSLLVTALTNEQRTRETIGWLRAQRAGSFSISEWVITEFSAAISVKQRLARLDDASRAATLQKFRLLIGSGMAVLTVTSSHFRAAAQFADQSQLGLRAGDALHLALASNYGAILHTLDGRLAAAGPPLGVRTVLL